jgi:hypothetical protein
VRPAPPTERCSTKPPYFFSQIVTTNIRGLPHITVLPSITNQLALSAGSLDAWQYNLKGTKILQWNFCVQPELGKDLMLDVSYVGSYGVDDQSVPALKVIF